MKINIKQIVLIILSSMLIGLSYNFLSANGVGLFSYDNKKMLSAELLGDNATEPKEIMLVEAFELYEAGVIFIDAREHEDYISGHIKNSVNIPYYDFDNYKNSLRNIPKDEPVVTYCGGTDCDLSIVLGNKLNSLGYEKVFVFFGGWEQWQDAEYPTAEGDGSK
ncbi:MAG: rhodanese-like domain-containing protein [Ignavibacteriaceae bacterium]